MGWGGWDGGMGWWDGTDTFPMGWDRWDGADTFPWYPIARRSAQVQDFGFLPVTLAEDQMGDTPAGERESR